MQYIYVIYIGNISADLSRASSVLDYTSLPTTSSPFQIPTPTQPPCRKLLQSGLAEGGGERWGGTGSRKKTNI